MTLGGNIAVIPFLHLITSISKLDNILSDRYLSLEDNIFVENVVADIQNFLRRGERNKASVLIFPPVNNYRRFLIHRVCEENLSKELSTFSVGQGFNRRTVVCFKGLVRKSSILNKTHDQSLLNVEDQISGMMVVERQPISTETSSPDHQCQNGSVKRVRASPAIYRPPAARKLDALCSQGKQNSNVLSAAPATPVASKSERTRSGTRQRRPDLQVYVPRAKRASMGDQNTTERQIGHHEIPVNHQEFSDIKKNTPEPPTKSTRINSIKECLISSTHPTSEHIKQKNVKKVEVDKSIAKEDSSNLLKTDSIVGDLPEKCNTKSLVAGSNSDEVPAGCDSDEYFESPGKNCKHNETINSETEDLNFCSSTDSNEFDYVSDLCNKINEDNTDVALNDSKNNFNALLVKDCNEIVDEEIQMNDGKRCVDHESKDTEISVNDLELCSEVMGVRERELTECNGSCELKLQENSCEMKLHENEDDKKIITGNVVSDVLVISDPKPVISLIQDMPKEDDLERSLADLRKTKVKHKSESSSTEKKNENAITSTTSSVVSLNPDECTWDMLFDDNGDCLDPKMMEELTNAVGSVTIEKPQSDYNRFISRPEINLPGGDGEFGHVVEIYSFPAEFKTQDLLSVFSPYKNGGFEIKWVDDTHALGVFSSSRVAADVLACDHPFVKTRPLSEATPESRMKARRSAEFLQPYRSRPETCVAMARRLVTGALGMRIATTREEREAEKRLLKEAREKKRLAARQQQDAWEGTIR